MATQSLIMSHSLSVSRGVSDVEGPRDPGPTLGAPSVVKC
jgi:hypothetical protein